MGKSRSFSIYLLKDSYNEGNALEDEDDQLESDVRATNLPTGASLYVRDSEPRSPWWKDYFGIRNPLSQVTKGALIFLPIRKRCFVLCFGHVAHYLRDTSYEYDFGLRVTLNSLDPQRLKSTETLEPSAARRQRTQVPIESDLTYFDFDRDSTILKGLTGKVKDEHKDLFRHATGASNLRISSDVAPDELVELCEKLLELYDSTEYKTTFPDIQNIAPVRDPVLIEQLNGKLLTAIHDKDDSLNLAVPALIHYDDNVYACFSGAGSSEIYDDVYMGRYYEYLDDRGAKIAEIGIDELHKHKLVLTDEEGAPRGERFSIYKSLIFDTSIGKGREVYHLTEGNWYKVEAGYITKLQNFLDPLCVDINFPPYQSVSEGVYNKSVAKANRSIICLDTKNISPFGQTQIEPCDLYSVSNGDAVFHHVKISTLSSDLSHQFNQGTNAIELLRSEPTAVTKLKALIKNGIGKNDYATMIAPLDDQRHQVVFVIVTHKSKANRSANLPLFSRISLMRNMKSLQVMSVRAAFGFVEDKTPKTAGKKKTRKKAA